MQRRQVCIVSDVIVYSLSIKRWISNEGQFGIFILAEKHCWCGSCNGCFAINHQRRTTCFGVPGSYRLGLPDEMRSTYGFASAMAATNFHFRDTSATCCEGRSRNRAGACSRVRRGLWSRRWHSGGRAPCGLRRTS